MSDGRPFYQRQCLDCGARIGSAVATSIALAGGRQPPPFDTKLFETGEQKLDRLLKDRRDARRTAIALRYEGNYEAYAAYLLSDAWRLKRAQARERDKGVCQGCFARPATQAHHLTYAHLGDELLFELISVCDDCHARLHTAKTEIGR